MQACRNDTRWTEQVGLLEDGVVDGRSLVRSEDEMDPAVVGLDGVGIGVVAGALDERIIPVAEVRTAAPARREGLGP